MTPPLCATPVDAVLESIEPTLTRIEFEAADVDARELRESLRHALMNLMRSLERDPGIETATADLYAAAAALADDGLGCALPPARKLRLFRDARARFRDRLSRARPCAAGGRAAWRLEELLMPA